MKKKNTGLIALLIAYWVLALIPLIAILLTYPQIQDNVAIHFGTGGVPDRWGEKWEILFIPAGIFVFAAVMLIITSVSANHSSQPLKNRTVSLLMLLGAMVVFNILTAWIIAFNSPSLSNLTDNFDIAKLSFIYIGALMIFLGIFTTKLTKNFASGARVPWNLTEEAWQKLQFFSQKVLFIGGTILIIACVFFLQGWSASVFLLVFLTALCLIIVFYGWRLRESK